MKFDKEELVNLEYSLPREVLATNKTGGYLNTTIVGCNTRKYHGLFVLPIEKYEGRRYVLLSSLDETLIQHGSEFNLGIRLYGKNTYEPRGHKYIVDFECDKAVTITYMVGGIRLSKSMLFLHNKEQLLIKYTLLDTHAATYLRLKPFLAFRDIHELTHANDVADTGCRLVENGSSYRMYEGFPDVNVQLSKQAEYVHYPDWYYDVEYSEERRRGFEYKEDLFNPGYFQLPIEKGESVVVSISTKPVNVESLLSLYEKEERSRISLQDYSDCLRRAAKQFIVSPSGKQDWKEVYSGYTWLRKGLRETMIALPGITLYADGDVEVFDEILKTALKVYDRQLMCGSKQVEAALWLFHVLQEYIRFTGKDAEVWAKYKEILVQIVQSFADGRRMGVSLADNGLLWVRLNGVATTWMNAYDKNGNPITERAGFQVETNAFWYNAICFMCEMEKKFGGVDKASVYLWYGIRERIDASFRKVFWMSDHNCLADYVDEAGQNKFIRPNQIFPCVLEYSPLTDEEKGNVMETVRKELLTERGIRTLSPGNLLYKGVYDGNQDIRDHAYHQGSTRVWLLTYYIEAMCRLYGGLFVKKAEELIAAFEEDITVHGVGAVCELYDGNPPHNPHGAISSSVATASLLRSEYLVNQYKKEEK